MISLNDFTSQMSKSDTTQTLQTLWSKWNQKKNLTSERWDVASTGCVGNITPIFGYLWLMVAAAAENKSNMFVTKLPSKGGSCGTVDILESGGFSFPSAPQAIFQQCPQQSRGVICQPSEDLAPVDKVLMDVRRETNLMTNFSLVYASILSKRMAIGCTHCIVDVKIGRDTKMLAPWMSQKQLDLVTENYIENSNQKLVIDCLESLEIYKQLLIDAGAAKSDQLTIQQQQWIEQQCQGELGNLAQIRWLLTNSSMPQCRAIGRQLILHHIDELISKKDNLLTRSDGNEYEKLYRHLLPNICQVDYPDWQELQTQWKILQSRLPKLNDFVVRKYLSESSYDSLEKSYGELETDLKIISFGIYPYQLQPEPNKKLRIQKMDAYFLDNLFEWLCGNDTYDPEVGIWLHKLPGEEVELGVAESGYDLYLVAIAKLLNDQYSRLLNFYFHTLIKQRPSFKWLESTHQWHQPIISILYRPSRCSELEVIAKARKFLCAGVSVRV